MQYCRSLHAHGQLSNKVASRPSYTCSLRNCSALASSMFQGRGKHLLLLSPAQPFPQLDQRDGPSLPKVNPLTPAATPVHNLGSQILPSWSDAGHSMWRHNKLDTTSLHREYRVDHGVIQAYHCSPGSHYHAPMLLRDRDMSSLCLSHETDRPLEWTSIPCLPTIGTLPFETNRLIPNAQCSSTCAGGRFLDNANCQPSVGISISFDDCF